MQILLDSDVDENFEFDDYEIDIMILKFSLLHFCDVNEDKFRSAMHAMKGNNIESFGTLAKDLLLFGTEKYGLAFDFKLFKT